jgi:predicted nucleotidyltransferase
MLRVRSTLDIAATPQTQPDSLIALEMIERAACMLGALAPRGSEVILFGSYARGDAGPESDLDFLVVEPTLPSRHAEMVRLRLALRPLRIPVDVLVVSRKVFDEWKALPNNVIYEANLEGKTMSKAPTPAQILISKARAEQAVAWAASIVPET